MENGAVDQSRLPIPACHHQNQLLVGTFSPVWNPRTIATGFKKSLFQIPDLESDTRMVIRFMYYPKGGNGLSTSCFGKHLKNRTFDRAVNIVRCNTDYIQLKCECGMQLVCTYCICAPGTMLYGSCFVDHVNNS